MRCLLSAHQEVAEICCHDLPRTLYQWGYHLAPAGVPGRRLTQFLLMNDDLFLAVPIGSLPAVL